MAVMSMRGMGLAIAIATFGALGNALFAYSQRRADSTASPFAFVTLLVSTCLVLCLVSLLFMPRVNLLTQLRYNGGWAAGGGLGLYMTLVCFYFLFTRFGASYYALYAVIALLTTTLLVGQILLGEPINRFHVGSVCCAISAVILFTLGHSYNTS